MIKPTGCSAPLSWQQIFSWFLNSFWIVSFGLMIPLYDFIEKIVLVIFFSGIFVALVFYMMKISKSDPTDPFVAKFKECVVEDRPFLEEFNNFCALCGTPVQDQSKHCMVCYRCVNHFDHHCTWVNNCIGKVNYSDFFRMILWFECLVVVVFAISVRSLNVIWNGGESEGYKSDKGLLVIICVSCISAGIVMILNTYLILFHCWLMKTGMTTFEYLMRDNKVGIEPDRSDIVKEDAEMVRLNKSDKKITGTAHCSDPKSSRDEI